MTRHSKRDLQSLRQIGWEYWDPIGIRSVNDHDWRNQAADEYDEYLLHVAKILAEGASVADGVIYLDGIVVEHMGLDPANEGDHKSTYRTVEAISNMIKYC